ncbi:FHA domain-containing protein [Nocardia sp. BMG51109]|uniref:FHA domain-containing protein n=1 Tax=Nocardia sp. BMG51109 TaxID=1056816 RepID=UPI0004671531|nr:FHA domain-containing protein [Nocardia sp. BMG51109]
MRDRQVEVVGGRHVAVRVAGAVVLVGHRGPGPVHADAPAMLAAEALAQLVSEASEQAPAGPGRLIARETTGWLMRDAEQISPGRPIDLGILSRADTGGVAIFLHGAVTAVLAGERGLEHYRGVDAAFTVDRVAEPPSRAVALFVDDDRGRIPELPERGIGSLVEGVAPAAGAIVWFEAERTRARDRARTDGGAHRRAEQPGPPSAIAPEAGARQPAPETVPDPNRQPLDPDPRISDDPQWERRLAETQLGRPAPEPHPGTPPPGTDFGARQSPPAETPAAGTDAAAPPPDPDLERRMEETTRADSPTVRVVGFKCARAHPTDPRSAFCTVCGMPVDQTQHPAEVVRPPLGMLVLDDGMSYLLATDAVIGRDPENSDAAQRGLIPLKIEDSSGGMSRAHAEIHLADWDVTLVDRGSTNGTHARLPGYQDWIRLAPRQPMTLVYGAEIMLGNRVLRLEPAAPPPFG